VRIAHRANAVAREMKNVRIAKLGDDRSQRHWA
jgi:hypothetical protein